MREGVRQLDSIEKYPAEGEEKGIILVIADYRSLNVLHGSVLSNQGYTTYTAITCSDIPRIFEKYKDEIAKIDCVVFASLVHGWHHQEGERRPKDLSEKTDEEWQTRNIKNVIKRIQNRQKKSLLVLIAGGLIECWWYQVSEESLKKAGIKYVKYPDSDPTKIIEILEERRSQNGTDSPFE